MLMFFWLVFGCNREDNCRDYVEASNACYLAYRGSDAEPLEHDEVCEPGDEDSWILGCMARAFDRDCESEAGFAEAKEEEEKCMSG